MSAYDTYLKQSGGAVAPAGSSSGGSTVAPKKTTSAPASGGSAYARYLNQSGIQQKNGSSSAPAQPVAPEQPATPELSTNPLVKAITGGTTLKQFAKDALGAIPDSTKKVSDFLINKPIDYLGSKLYDANPQFFDEASAGIDIQAKEGHKNAGVEILKTLQQGERAISGLTGGIISPKTETPDNIVSKIYGGFSEAIGSIVALQGIGAGLSRLTDTAKITGFLAEHPLVYKYALPYIQNAVGFSLYGQLDPNLAGNMTERLKKLGLDMVTSVPYTLLGGVKSPKISIPASFTLGFGMAKLQGASNEDAFISGIVLGGLDGYSRFGGTKEHFIDGRAVEKKLTVEALNTLNKYSDTKLTTKSSIEEIKKAYRKGAHATHPDTGGTAKDFIAVNSAYEFLSPKGSIGKTQFDSPAKTKGSEVVPQAPAETGAPKELATAPLDPAKIADTSAIELQKNIENGGVPTSQPISNTSQVITNTSDQPISGEPVPVAPAVPTVAPTPTPAQAISPQTPQSEPIVKAPVQNPANLNTTTPQVGVEKTARPAYEAFKSSQGDSVTPTTALATEANKATVEPSATPEKVSLQTKLQNQYPDVKLSLSETDSAVKVTELKGKKGDTKITREVLNELVNYADTQGKTLELPKGVKKESHDGLGFVANKEKTLTRQPLPKEEVHFRTKGKIEARLKETHTPEQKHELVKEVSNAYYDQVLKPKIDAGEAIVIGADDLKDYFGNDYDNKNHPIYSESASNLFKRAVIESPEDVVKFIAGGTGSGKSDFVVPDISEDFKGVVYDSTAWNPDGLLKQIDFVNEHGKKAEVYGIIPDLVRSRAYTFIRAEAGKHPVTETAFVNTHSGAIQTMLKVIETGGDVYVLDTRNITSKEQVDSAEFLHNPVELLQEVSYTKDHVKETISKVTAENAKEIIAKGQEGTVSVPQENRPNQIGLLDTDPSYTDHMNQLIKDAQDKGESFPYSEMSPAEQKIVDDAFHKMLSDTPIKTPKDFKPYEATLTTDTLDVKKLNDPAYYVKAYESAFAVGGDKGIYKILTHELVPEGKEASGFLADLFNKSKAEIANKKPATPNNQDLRIEAQPAPKPDESRTQTEVQGQKVNRFTGLPQEEKNPRIIGQQKPLVTKTGLKTILSTNPEFKKNPILTVEGEAEYKMFTWNSKDGKSSFKIKPSALGLVTENLQTGDRVRISPETFKDNGQELRVMKHDAQGGSSRYASIGRYRDGTEIALGQPDLIRPIEFPELVKLAKELSGNVPFIKKYTKANGMFYGRGTGEIGLNPDLFLKENNGQFAKTLAHEIGHLIDYLPDQTLTRGNLMGRLNTLRGFMKDFYAPAGQSRTDSAMRKELWELSKYWKPIDEATAPKAHLSYRKSAPELYADFISVLFNAPRTVTSIAPESYNTFFEQLDKKPLVKQAYFELQDFLRNGDRVATRRQATQEMFKETEQLSRERQIQNEIALEAKRRSVWFKFKHEFVDITEAVKEQVKKDKKAGIIVSDNNNPQYYLEERNYLGGKIRAMVDEKFNGIYQELQKQGMSWEDLGELMFYDRILKGDRQEVANPLGYQPDFVKELYESEAPLPPATDNAIHQTGLSDMKSTLGADKYIMLQKLADEYRANLRDVFKQGREAGLYSPEQEAMFTSNAFYVPFKGAKYSGVTKTTSGIKHQKGTLGGIENPANTGIEKAISIVKAIERNVATSKTVEYFQEFHGDEVIQAPKDQQGYPIEPRGDKTLGLVTYMKDGKVLGFHVDKYVADAIKRDTVSETNVLISSLRFANSGLFRPLFITFNLGFQGFNSIRDFKRFWKNVPDMTFLKGIKAYAGSVRASKIRAFGLPKNPSKADLEAHALINSLQKEGVLGITYNDISKGEDMEAKQLDRILQEVGLRESTSDSLGMIGDKLGVNRKSLIIRPIVKVLDFIENLGNMIETMPKVAGVQFLEGKMPPRELRSFVRKYVGSPDFQAGGKFKKYSNEIFLFSNAIAQGIRSDFEIATDPKTRGGYWYKTAKINLVPKLLMLLATLGLFGETLKELFGKISEYDKTNYDIIPVGIDENGKAVYIRIPPDETGKIIGGMFWKVAEAVKDPKQLGNISTYTDLINYAGGQVPSVTPIFSTIGSIGQYMAGNNPYDSFRGQPVLSDQQMQAGGTEKLKPFLGYIFEQLGGGVFAKLYSNQTTVPKTPTLSEKIVQLPVLSNIVGRFLKSSNYGETEQLRKITNEVKSVNAKESIKNKQIIYDYVDQSQGLPYAQAQALKHKMIADIYGGQPKTPEDRTQARAYEKRFDTLRLRGTADPRLDALLVAQSNDEKVALLQEFQKTMSTSDYNTLKQFIIKNRVVSSSVFQKLNQAQRTQQ